jgi:hypothetical protein
MQGYRASMDRFADVASKAGVPDRTIPIAEPFEVISERVFPVLRKRANRYHKSTIDIERILSWFSDFQSGVAVCLPASPVAPVES